MTIEISIEAKRLLSKEELDLVRESLDQFEAQAAIPKDPNGMRQDKTDFPLGIYDDSASA